LINRIYLPDQIQIPQRRFVKKSGWGYSAHRSFSEGGLKKSESESVLNLRQSAGSAGKYSPTKMLYIAPVKMPVLLLFSAPAPFHPINPVTDIFRPCGACKKERERLYLWVNKSDN